MTDRIAILGLGPVTPAGVGREELSAAVDEGIEPVAVGELNVQDYLDAAKTYLDPVGAMALVSVALALKDAGITVVDSPSPPAAEGRGEGIESTRIGMSFGTRMGSATTVEAYLKGFIEQGAKLASPLLFIHAYPNTPVSLAAIDFKLKGTSFNFDSGRFAGLQALVQAADELRRGGMSVMLAGAADTYTQATASAAAAAALSAAATVALGCREDAPVALSGCGLAVTLNDALARANVSISGIDWVLCDLDGVQLEDAGAACVTDLHDLVGDAGAATALAGVVLAAMVMQEGKTPATLGLAKAPKSALVLSADASGAAAVVLTRR